jgi:hypothetical protein
MEKKKRHSINQSMLSTTDYSINSFKMCVHDEYGSVSAVLTDVDENQWHRVYEWQ